MAITSTRRVGMSSPRQVTANEGRSQLVENVDTKNNVLVRDDARDDTGSQKESRSKQQNFSAYGSNISANLGALAMSEILENADDSGKSSDNEKVNTYSNNQSMVKDDDVERIGRSYLKKFYEENKPITDVDELV